jgi:2-keto-4-pentenoate hydratase/2-oxohepta-3-ene-1,7-dioic acid hydratase in catechol pathway
LRAEATSEDAPSFGPRRKLDYEIELAIWIGPGNELGEPIPIAQAADHVFPTCRGLARAVRISGRDYNLRRYQYDRFKVVLRSCKTKRKANHR